MLIKKDDGTRLNQVWRYYKKKRVLTYGAVCLLIVIVILGYLVAAGKLLPALTVINNEFYEVTGFDVGRYIDDLPYRIINIMPLAGPNPERISIDISYLNYRRLEYKRQIALADHILMSSAEDYVPATIQYEDQIIDVNLRLKGDWTDHLKGDKWSFRINCTGNYTLWGMDEFSIQAPETKNYLGEWLFYETLRGEEIISPRYEFIDVTINGEHKGIYAFEEHFTKHLIESNHYREGPILRFNEDIFWADRAQYFPLYMSDPTGLQSPFSSDIDVFQMNKTLADSTLHDQYITGMNLLESFRRGDLLTHQVFDVPKLARFIAIADLMGAEHALIWINMRLYLNPVTSLLEPIGFDANAGRETEDIAGLRGVPFSAVFSDPVFFKEYVRELERVSQEEYLNSLFVDLESDLERNLDILHIDYPRYDLSKDVFYQNQDLIKKCLNPVKGVHAFFRENTGNGSIILDVGNIQRMPVEIVSVNYNESQTLEPAKGTYLLQPVDGLVKYEKLEFVLPEDLNWSTDVIDDLTLNYSILGASRLRNETVFTWPYPSTDFLMDDSIRQEPNVHEFDFLFVDDVGKRIFIEYGDWTLNESVIVPAGYTLACGEGTTLDLRNGAKLLSYSPLVFLGTEDNPIIIESSDSTGQGIVVLGAGNNSVLYNVVLQDLSAPSEHDWELTGAITFYESPVEIDSCHFTGNNAGDDMLNIIRSPFEIRNSLFMHALFDALDVDFGSGSISGTSFIDCGNDGMDLSGSTVDVVECFINDATDKGISVGEDSQVNIHTLDIQNCYVALASKDISDVTVENIEISESEVGLAVYQKKPEFGPSAMTVSGIDMVNVITPYIVEVESTLLVDDQRVGPTQENVWESLYGNN